MGCWDTMQWTWGYNYLQACDSSCKFFTIGLTVSALSALFIIISSLENTL